MKPYHMPKLKGAFFVASVLLCVCSFLNPIALFAQNSKIKCYFNHPVNTTISNGVNAVYLNGTFDDTVAAYIDRAKYSVDIAQYDYTSTSSSNVKIIATAANNAILRGVTVRWIYDGASSNSGLAYLSPSIKTLGSPTTSAYGIMHHKFMVIDVNSANSNDAIVMTGSYDWSTQQTNTDFNNLLFIQDKNVALSYYKEFNQMWGGTGSSPVTANEKFGPDKSPSSQYIFNVNGTTVELYFSPQDTVKKRLQAAVNSANSDLFFGIYTFTDNTIANLIKTKYNSGVSVKGIMDNFSTSYSPYTTLSPVLGSNMLVYSGTGIYHNKIMLIDPSNSSSDPQVFTGSFNWTTAAETMNDEDAIIVHDASYANQYLQSLCQNFADIGGSSCSPVILTIQWVNLRATPDVNSNIMLDWSVTNASDSKYYEIEHSPDDIHFESIGTINSKPGNASDIQQYQFADANPYPGTTFYRVKEVDNNNRSTYSDIISSTSTVTAVKVYPNPVTDFLHVRTVRANSTIRISNCQGQILKTSSRQDVGTNSLYVADLPKGVYVIEIISSEGKSRIKFIKE